MARRPGRQPGGRAGRAAARDQLRDALGNGRLLRALVRPPRAVGPGHRQPPDGGHRRAVRPVGHRSRRPVHLRAQPQAPRPLPEVRLLAALPHPGDDQDTGGPTTVAPCHPLHRAPSGRAHPRPRRLPGTDRQRLRGARPGKRDPRRGEPGARGGPASRRLLGLGGHGHLPPRGRNRSGQPGLLRQVRTGQTRPRGRGALLRAPRPLRSTGGRPGRRPRRARGQHRTPRGLRRRHGPRVPGRTGRGQPCTATYDQGYSRPGIWLIDDWR